MKHKNLNSILVWPLQINHHNSQQYINGLRVKIKEIKINNKRRKIELVKKK